MCLHREYTPTEAPVVPRDSGDGSLTLLAKNLDSAIKSRYNVISEGPLFTPHYMCLHREYTPTEAPVVPRLCPRDPGDVSLILLAKNLDSAIKSRYDVISEGPPFTPHYMCLHREYTPTEAPVVPRLCPRDPGDVSLILLAKNLDSAIKSRYDVISEGPLFTPHYMCLHREYTPTEAPVVPRLCPRDPGDVSLILLAKNLDSAIKSRYDVISGGPLFTPHYLNKI